MWGYTEESKLQMWGKKPKSKLQMWGGKLQMWGCVILQKSTTGKLR